MPITFKKTVAVLTDPVVIEDAEILLDWLIEHPKGRVNLKAVRYAHTAVWQVLMAIQPTISAWPDDAPPWMRQTLTHTLTE